MNAKKETLVVSFSGGRTSAYMARWLQLNKADEYELKFVFMNTGGEDERTLNFVNQCDKEFGFNLVWIEADVIHGERVGTKYKIVDFETASRNHEPFYDVVKKYGIPNQSYPHCNRELKLAPFNEWLKDNCPNAYRAIGIRCDEIDRMAADMDKMKIVYPFIKWHPTRKGDVLGWWSRQSFDLDVPEHYGNCVTCWKKSDKKLLTIAHESPELFDHFHNMEIIARGAGANAENNKGNFFRKNRSTQDILELSRSNFEEFKDKYYNTANDISNGCSDSCDLFG
jgi:hypothetical protein